MKEVTTWTIIINIIIVLLATSGLGETVTGETTGAGTEKNGPAGDQDSFSSYRLFKDLLTNYKRDLRPVSNHTHVIKVFFEMALINILSLNTRNQKLTTNTEVVMKWHDDLLTWDPDLYNGMTEIRVPYKDIWHPDITLRNTADSSYELGILRSNAIIKYNGEVELVSHAFFQSTCTVDTYYYPFDQQECHMKFSSWTFTIKELTIVKSLADLSEYSPSPEFFLEDFYSTVTIFQDPCCANPFTRDADMDIVKAAIKASQHQPTTLIGEDTDLPILLLYYAEANNNFRSDKTTVPKVYNISELKQVLGSDYVLSVVVFLTFSVLAKVVTFYLKVQRRTVFAIFFLVLPGTIVNIAALFTFLLPADCGEKISLASNSLLAMMVFLMSMTQDIPPSQFVPLIGRYYGGCILLLTVNIGLTVISLRCHSLISAPVPHALRVMIKVWGKILCVPPPKEVQQAWQDHKTDMPHKVRKVKPVSLHTSDGSSIIPHRYLDLHLEKVLHRRVGVSSSTSLPDSTSNNEYQQRMVGSLEAIHLLLVDQELRQRAAPLSETTQSSLQVLEWRHVSRVLDQLFFLVAFVAFVIFNGMLLWSSPFREKFEYCPDGPGTCPEHWAADYYGAKLDAGEGIMMATTHHSDGDQIHPDPS
ncbi:hypothetical protein Pcinc_023902 [Petrolisthes cinctipes]|uniref:Uncharacterized protein n=2 Tax=Petrolisthes cinctipes TaxID=88211 RepID=A0AAE1FBZ5_PETCI|nr:hypothetical protein Pcinc_023902 [Petrolisthes cinctipes]